jgi:hypothetical protein
VAEGALVAAARFERATYLGAAAAAADASRSVDKPELMYSHDY